MLKRLLSNLIDFLIFCATLFLAYLSSGLEVSNQNASFIYILSFFITFVFPILILKNTLGKELLKISWLDGDELKIKLIIKYLIYFVSIFPSFSFIGLISNFPFILTQPTLNLVFSLKVLTVYTLTDLIFFIASLGRFHVLDYLLNIKIQKRPFNRSAKINLGIAYTFFGGFFLLSLLSYRLNFSDSMLQKTFSSSLYKENFPKDLYCGNQVFVLKNFSSNAFTPSVPMSFIIKRNIEQKTLYLNLPDEVFNSKFDREQVCINLISQSLTNDIFNRYHPQQTRIILTNFRKGKYLEYYNYFYFYYYNNTQPLWGINGGINVDSLTYEKYTKFITDVHSRKISGIERKYNLTWKELINKSVSNKELNAEINNLFSYAFISTISKKGIKINVDSSFIELEKISFSDSKINGYMNINFPITDLEYRIQLNDFLSGKMIELDDNVSELMFIRDVITDENL